MLERGFVVRLWSMKTIRSTRLGVAFKAPLKANLEFMAKTTFLCLVLGQSGCLYDNVTQTSASPQSPQDGLTRVIQRGSLVVATQASPITYYDGPEGPDGYEYRLAQAFARHLGVSLDIRTLDSVEEIVTAVETGQADIAATGLPFTPKLESRLQFSTPYQESGELVIYRTGYKRPRAAADLVGAQLVVTASSPHTDTLENLKRELPELNWQQATGAHPAALLAGVASSRIQYALIDSNSYVKLHGLFPELRIGFEIRAASPIAWGVARNDRLQPLLDEINAFFQIAETSGQLAQLDKRFYGYAPKINSRGLTTFRRFARTRLPRYKAIIREIAKNEGVDWRLLAAISYQESHWNPMAVSPTGVRGMMMLTKTTADELGIGDRTDARQSLRGGARYFKKMLARIPGRIDAPDRYAFALAAYNIGFGHLEDARVITQSQGGNPDCWNDVARHLPLLRNESWYAHTRHGFARGDESVQFVSNIRRYYNIISMSELVGTRPELESRFTLASTDDTSRDERYVL